jgi:hypothetical protein
VDTYTDRILLLCFKLLHYNPVQETKARALSTSHNSTDEVTNHSLTADRVTSDPPHFEPWPLLPGRLHTSTISNADWEKWHTAYALKSLNIYFIIVQNPAVYRLDENVIIRSNIILATAPRKFNFSPQTLVTESECWDL